MDTIAELFQNPGFQFVLLCIAISLTSVAGLWWTYKSYERDDG